MKWISGWALSALALAAFHGRAAGEPRAAGATERELRQLDRHWAEFAVRGDLELFDRLTADDHIATHASGKLVTRAEEKAYIRKSPERLASISTDDVSVRVHGDTAVILGRVTVKSKKGNEARYRYTTVWLKRNQRWRLIAEQHTAIDPPPPAAAPASAVANERTPEQVVRDYAKACNDFDLAAFVALHDSRVRKYTRAGESGKPAPGKAAGEFVLTTSGRDEVKRKYQQLFARTPRSVRVEIVSMMSLGDLVLSRDRVTGFPDAHVSDEITMYQVRDGLIQNIWYIARRRAGS
jgi:ketosteroid isomerase-like protein